MRPVSTAAQMRALDAAVIEGLGLPGIALMELASRGVADVVRALQPTGTVLVLCGPGNNGGDGWAVARWLHGWGLAVQVLPLGEPTTGDAGAMARVARAAGVAVVDDPREPALVVDALFGTGLTRAVSGRAADLLRSLQGVPTVAVDIPSGLHADTGERLGPALRADHTVTFGRPKLGMFLRDGPALCGRVHVVDIGLCAATADGERVAAWLVEEGDARVPDRPVGAHKRAVGDLLPRRRHRPDPAAGPPGRLAPAGSPPCGGDGPGRRPWRRRLRDAPRVGARPLQRRRRRPRSRRRAAPGPGAQGPPRPLVGGCPCATALRRRRPGGDGGAAGGAAGTTAAHTPRGRGGPTARARCRRGGSRSDRSRRRPEGAGNDAAQGPEHLGSRRPRPVDQPHRPPGARDRGQRRCAGWLRRGADGARPVGWRRCAHRGLAPREGRGAARRLPSGGVERWRPAGGPPSGVGYFGWHLYRKPEQSRVTGLPAFRVTLPAGTGSPPKVATIW